MFLKPLSFVTAVSQQTCNTPCAQQEEECSYMTDETSFNLPHETLLFRKALTDLSVSGLSHLCITWVDFV